MSLFRDLIAKAYAAAHGAQSAPGIDVEDLKAMLEKKEDVVLVDVREDWEWDKARIEGARHIPLGQLPDRVGELEKAAQTVVYCKLGGRSARAVIHLRRCGFENVLNLDGGIDAWAEHVDPKVPRY
ncbi:MAG: sulfurtransferase [Elusimicrobia bacterium]|nr:sulfurtransferase [Elusimicrobiota bacterium]